MSPSKTGIKSRQISHLPTTIEQKVNAIRSGNSEINVTNLPTSSCTTGYKGSIAHMPNHQDSTTLGDFNAHHPYGTPISQAFYVWGWIVETEYGVVNEPMPRRYAARHHNCKRIIAANNRVQTDIALRIRTVTHITITIKLVWIHIILRKTVWPHSDSHSRTRRSKNSALHHEKQWKRNVFPLLTQTFPDPQINKSVNNHGKETQRN